MFKAAHVSLNISIFEATQRATLREAAGPPCQEETRIREQKRQEMCTDTRGDCASLRLARSRFGGSGEGGILHPLVGAQEREHTPAAVVSTAVLEAGSMLDAQGQPRALRAPETRAARARRLQAALRGRGAPGEAGGKRPVRGAAL